MTRADARTGGRRVDRVLADGSATGLAELDLDELRSRRREAEQEEADLSYLRRMLQGRMSTSCGRARPAPGRRRRTVVDAAVRASWPTAAAATRGLGRHLTVEPSRVDEHRRGVEQLIADVGMSDVAGRTDDELRGALERARRYEHGVSEVRRAVQDVMDALTAEIARRYRDGAATVDDLLATPHRVALTP